MEGLLVIVPCGQKKIWDSNPSAGKTGAKDAYIGPPFRVNREYAEAFAQAWVILSAKYGFVHPNFPIPRPYNVSFKDPSTHPIAALTLCNQVRDQELDRFSVIIGLGGKEYRQVTTEAFKPFHKTVCFPFAGLTIGRAMRAVKSATKSGKPIS